MAVVAQSITAIVFIQGLMASRHVESGGDRKYMADGKLREETFYFLFHATGTKNSSTVYSVTPSLSQDYENTSSLFHTTVGKNFVSFFSLLMHGRYTITFS